jgi:hypothetical protein
MILNKFTARLASPSVFTIVFKDYDTSNYWKQKALSFDHDARLISAS